MSANYVAQVGKNYEPDPSEPILPGLFQQYERVLVESLVSSFALDFLIKDQHGGDVDTVRNVRKIGEDPQMTYKSTRNATAYELRGDYDKDSYHKKNDAYKQTRDTAKRQARDGGTGTGTIIDAYTGKRISFAKSAPPGAKASLDHVISAYSINEDRGRVLAGVRGQDLANSPENLRFTNLSLNSSMQEDAIPDYIAKHPELSGTTKANMMREYEQAKKAYESKINRAYYTGPNFRKDMAKAAGNVGIRMGARQALGFVFAEMWFAVKEEFTRADKEKDFDLGDFLSRIGRGLKRGLENAKQKYATLFSRALDGAVAGALSSVTTTLCNIFISTSKNVVRMIRQVYPSLVEAAKILFINPECYPFGERMRAVAKILATGASIVMGVSVSDVVEKTPIGTIPVVGEIVPVFCSVFVSGIMSCTLLYFLDRSPMINQLVKTLDKMHTIDTEVNYFRQYAEYFERYAAGLMAIDLDEFRRETTAYHNTAVDLENAKTEQEMNLILKNAYETLHLSLPWKGEFDAFMQNKTQHLVFE